MKRLLLLTLTAITVFFTGCRKEIKRVEENVQVTIAGSYHQDKIEDHWYDWNTKQWKSKVRQYEENTLYLEYEGKEYELNGESYYRHYGNRIGDEITATLITHIYDDGTSKEELRLN